MSGGWALAFDAVNNRLFYGDISNNRVLVFNTASITDGMNAVHVLGQTDFISAGTALTQSGFNNPEGLAYDPNTNRLFVDDFNNSRVLVFNTTNITDGMNAINVLGTTSFTASGSGTTQSTFAAPEQIYYDPGSGRLFVAEQSNSRITIFDASTISSPAQQFFLPGYE